jgi:hypothetical protein
MFRPEQAIIKAIFQEIAGNTVDRTERLNCLWCVAVYSIKITATLHKQFKRSVR